MNVRNTLAIAALVLAIPAVSPAQSLSRHSVTTGGTVQLGVYSYVPDRCIARGRVQLEVIRAPSRGRLTVRNDEPFTIRMSNYAVCVGKPSIGTGLFYQGDAPGEDAMRVAVTYPDGHRETLDFAVTVQPGPANAPSR